LRVTAAAPERRVPWKKNKLLAKDFPDLAYMPRGRCEWDFTLASIAFAARRQIDIATGRAIADLNAWAARHGLPASRRYGGIFDIIDSRRRPRRRLKRLRTLVRPHGA